jgi:hypothetical protein
MKLAFTTTVALAGLTGAAFAADLPARRAMPPAPAASAACLETNALPTDVFGFTTGSDVTDVGAWGGTVTANGVFTSRSTRVSGVTGVAQVATGLFRCFEIAPYAFLGGADATARGGASGSSTAYGGGIEAKYKFLGRDLHGVGATVDLDVSAGNTRFSGLLGAGTVTSYNVAARLFLDRELVAGLLYGALNLEHVSTFSRVAGVSADASQFNVRAALSAKVAPNLFVGAEALYSRTYQDAGYGRFLGDAFMVGPNMLWAINDKWTFNAAYQIQVAGKARALPGDLNLNQYTMHYARVKLGYAF